MESRIEAQGFELVDLEWAGARSRPIMRVRIDLPDAGPGRGVTVDDCAQVSRAVEGWLDELPDFPERYVLEVSSPGVERPLTRRRDWARFAGQKVVVRGHGVLVGRSTRLEGELLGVEGDGEGEDGYRVRLRLANGDEVEVEREKIAGGNILFEWE
ncbi:MAG: ribosome maturation factor RimP [Gemmatimonadota bacterium]